MAEITRRRQGEILQAVLRLLKDFPEGLAAQEVIREVETAIAPTPFELAEYAGQPGVRRIVKIIRFSTISAVKAGWMIKAKGTWIPTSEGLDALTKWPDPEKLFRESIHLYNEWKKAQPEVSDDGETLDESAPHPSVTLEEAEETARQEVFEYLAKMPPYDLQELVAALLRAMGYHVAWVAPPGPDKGIDVLAYTDPLGAEGPRIKVQVKRRADKIAVHEVRSFFAVLGPSDVGIFVSLGGFTSEAQVEARQQENRRVSLLGAGDLVDLWIEHYGELGEPARQLLPLQPIYYLAPAG